MKKISKEKRQQLTLTVLITVTALAGLWFGLVRTQMEAMGKIAARKTAARDKFEEVKRTIEAADQIEGDLGRLEKVLAQREEDMATGDLYAWAITTIRQFKLPYKVEIPQFSQIEGPKDVSMIPGFPYKQASLTIAGSAYFHDFGLFLADFENQFPYIRVQNVSLEPTSALLGADREKLAFKMEIVALVKPNITLLN